MYVSLIVVLAVALTLVLILAVLNSANNAQQVRVPLYIRTNERRQMKQRHLPPDW